MINSNPIYLYKYRKVSNTNNLKDDFSIKSLFDCEINFSGRKKFNDPFDSKIEFVIPKSTEINHLSKRLGRKHESNFSEWTKNGIFTTYGNLFIERFENEINKLLDGYPIYCLAEVNNSNLMWAHYAGDHTGFCIEFLAERMNAQKIIYQDELPKIKIMDFLKAMYFDENSAMFSEKLFKSLLVKLNDWSYEKERRILLQDKEAEKIIGGGGRFIKKYPSDLVSSVIFGLRADVSTKDFIIKNIPFPVKFREAYVNGSKISIRDLKQVS